MGLLAWGALYLLGCLNALSAPGRAVRLEYLAEGGKVVFTAKTFALDPFHGRLSVSNPRVVGPQGLIFACLRVEAEGLRFDRGESDPIKVRLLRPTAVLRRDRSGKFEIQSLLPKREGPPSKIPFTVEAAGAQVQYIDATRPEGWRVAALAPKLTIDGIGDRWLASGRLLVAGAGALDASAQSTGESDVTLRVSAKEFEAATLLNGFRETVDGRQLALLKDFDAASLKVTGKATVIAQPGQRTTFAGQVSASGVGVRYTKYEVAEAKFTGQFGTDGARGLIAARAPSLDGAFDGQIAWSAEPVLAGRLRLSNSNLDSSPGWFRSLVPKQLTFGGARFDGILAYGKPNGLQLQGPVALDSAKVNGETLGRTSMRLHIDAHALAIAGLSTTWNGQPIEGALQVGFDDKRLAGAFVAKHVDLRTLAKRFDLEGLTGTGQASTLVSGSLERPSLAFDARGSGSYQRIKNASFSVAASSDGKMVTVQRGLIRSAQGALALSGTAPISGDGLKLDWLASDVAVSRLVDGATGTLGGAGSIRGSLKRPRYSGSLEAIGLKRGEIDVPFAAVNIRGDRDWLEISDPRILKGPTAISGSARWNFHSGALNGSFEVDDIQPSLWADLGITGLVDLKNGRLSGTLDHPVASGQISSDGLFIGDRLARNIRGSVGFLRGIATLDAFTADLFAGKISGSARYDISAEQGSFAVELKDAQVAKIAELAPESGEIAGALSGSAKGAIGKNGKLTVEGAGQANDLRLNGIALGSGDLTFNGDGDAYGGSLRIGNLDRYQLLDNIRYNRATGSIAGDLLIANTPLNDVYRATERLLPALPESVANTLRSITGNVNADGVLSGQSNDPDFELKLLEGTDLTIQGRSAGALKLSGRKRGSVIDQVDLSLIGPLGRLALKGNADTRGDLQVDGDLTGLELSVLGLFSPSFNALQGQADLSFSGSGPTKSPIFRASLETSKDALVGFTAEDGTVTTVPDFKVVIDSISLEESTLAPSGGYTGGFRAEGLLTYRGIQANLRAGLPFTYSRGIPEGAELDAALTLPEREIDSLKALLSGIDVAKTHGTIGGEIRLHGPLDRVALDGKLAMNAPKLGFEGLQSEFADATATLTLTGNVLTAEAAATGSRGGTFKANARTQLADAGGFALLDSATLDSIFDRSLSGRIDVSSFRMAERLPGKGSVDGLVSGALDLSGPIRSALLSGRFAVSQGQLVLPSEEAPAGEAPDFAIDPRFQIDFALSDPMKIRSSTTNIEVTGSGGASGTLNRPDVFANLNVEKGTFKLPTAKVTLDPDGSVRARYQAGAADGQDARIDVDLQGRTRIVARNFTERVQRYDVRLDIRGDLLKDGGLNLNATSSPPDLTQEQILALLGQADALSGLSGIGSDRQAQQKVRDALAGFAVPALLDPFTSKLGAALGLDSLTLEFNLGSQASVSFGKALGRDFTLSGRRQITDPGPGQRLEFSFDLTYRPPSLRRFSLSFGIDQDRPYKLSFEYGFRF